MSDPLQDVEPSMHDGHGPESLSLWDAVSLIIGIVIGSMIFKTSGIIASSAGGPWSTLGLWLVCGGFSLVGALCYAELATTYPRLGGDYNYLSRAFGDWAGFLFGWCELWLIQTCSIGALAYVASEYAAKVFRVDETCVVWLAMGTVIFLTGLNMLGIRAGKRTQNILSTAKVIGVLMLIAAGLISARMAGVKLVESMGAREHLNPDGWPLALILILYAYGGWNDAAFVAANVRDARRNVPRALVLGIGFITACYLLINSAYLAVLGFDGLKGSFQPAADAMKKVFGATGEWSISLLVMISALGSVNGLIFSVSRLHATVGADHRVFALLGRWSTRTNAPVWSLLVQGVISVGMILSVGTASGRAGIDRMVGLIGLHAVNWGKYYGGFDTLFAMSAPVFWFFFLSTGIAYFVLRCKEPEIERPFRAPLFPLCPLLFCLMCGFGLFSATRYAWELLPLVVGPIVIGIPVFLVDRRMGARRSK